MHYTQKCSLDISYAKLRFLNLSFFPGALLLAVEEMGNASHRDRHSTECDGDSSDGRPHSILSTSLSVPVSIFE